MNAQPQFDFSHVSDEELFNPGHAYWVDKVEENAAWRAEQQRRKETKRLEQERLEQERYAQFMARKAAIGYSEALAQEIVERVGSGEFLTLICADAHMPTMRNACPDHLVKATSTDPLDDQVFISSLSLSSEGESLSKHGVSGMRLKCGRPLHPQ